MRARASSVQRWATFSPARWMTASRPLTASAAIVSPRVESLVTSSPRSVSLAVSLVPMRPPAPVIVIRMLVLRGSGPDGPKLGRLAARVADLGAADVRVAAAPGLVGHGVGDGIGHVAVEDARDHVLLAQVLVLDDARDPARGGHLHLLGDVARADVERAAEDAGEAEDVVDLVRVVAAARGDHARVGLGLLRGALPGRGGLYVG